MPNFTKQAIKSSFLKLLSEQPLNKISVRSIVEDCGINRNSFYYHFQDIPSLLREVISDELSGLTHTCSEIPSLDECVNVAFDFALRNKKAVMHIYNSVNRDIYEKSMMKLCEYVVSTYLDTAFGTDAISAGDRAVITRFFKCELYGLFSEWIVCGMKDDMIEDIHRISKLCSGFSDEVIRRSRDVAGPKQHPNER